MAHNWDAYLVNRRDCFLYVGDDSSSSLFQGRTGRTVTEFAEDFWNKHSSAWSMLGVPVSKQDVTRALLEFWADRIKLWRKEFKSVDEAQQASKARFDDRYGSARKVAYESKEDSGHLI